MDAIKILASLLATKKCYLCNTSCIRMYNMQVARSQNLDLLLVYVPNCKSLDPILAQSGSLDKYLQMLIGIIFRSAQVSILAHRNLVSFLCSLTLNSKFVNRPEVYLALACSVCTFICKQKDSSLDELSLEWLHIELSCVDNLPLVNIMLWVIMVFSCKILASCSTSY